MVCVCGGGGTSERGRVNGGDLGAGVWLVDFIYLYETELRDLLQLL
jgi:hypothetical protein